MIHKIKRVKVYRPLVRAQFLIQLIHLFVLLDNSCVCLNKLFPDPVCYLSSDLLFLLLGILPKESTFSAILTSPGGHILDLLDGRLPVLDSGVLGLLGLLKHCFGRFCLLRSLVLEIFRLFAFALSIHCSCKVSTKLLGILFKIREWVVNVGGFLLDQCSLLGAR